MKSIRWILFLTFVAVILVAVGTVAAITIRSAATEIAEYDNLNDELEMTRITHWLTGYYALHDSWDDVQPFVDEIGVMYGRRIVLTDTSGQVVADTRTDEPALFGGSQWRTRSLQFDRYDAPVGTVHANHDFTIVDSFRQRLAISIRRLLLFGSVVAIAIALLVSFAVSHSVVKPIEALARVSDRAAGGDLAVRATASRVRELRSLALAFNRMMDDLQAAETLRDNMIADVAHELRTPLSNVRGYLEALRDGVVDQVEAVTVVDREMAVLTRLVDDLHDLSATDSGEVVLVRERTDLRDMVRQVAERFGSRAASRSVRIRAGVPDTPAVGFVDPVRVSQMLGNLVSNAITHSVPGGTIDLGLSLDDVDLTITVADEGTGVPAAHLPFIFERFYRADSSRSRSTGGHGLGLPIARSIALAHGGALTVKSTEGSGSCFTVVLPVAPGPSGPGQTRPS